MKVFRVSPTKLFSLQNQEITRERLPNPVPGTLTPSAAVIEREIRQRVKKLVRQEADFWSSLIYWHGRLILKQADQTGGWGLLATEKSITGRQVSV